MIRDALRAKFGKDVYTSEVDDGEDVLVKARGSTPDFDLVVARNTAEGNLPQRTDNESDYRPRRVALTAAFGGPGRPH